MKWGARIGSDRCFSCRRRVTRDASSRILQVRLCRRDVLSRIERIVGDILNHSQERRCPLRLPDLNFCTNDGLMHAPHDQEAISMMCMQLADQVLDCAPSAVCWYNMRSPSELRYLRNCAAASASATSNSTGMTGDAQIRVKAIVRTLRSCNKRRHIGSISAAAARSSGLHMPH